MNYFTKYLQGQLKRFLKNQPLLKRADVGKYLGIENIKTNFKDFPSHYTQLRSDLEGDGQASSLGRTKYLYDIFINLDGSLEMTARSKKPKAVALVKWLSKKGVEKIQEEHQQGIEEKDNQIQALEHTNEKHQQSIEEKDTTIALLNDDLKNREHDNVAVQAQRDVYKEQLQKCQGSITHLKKRHVPHVRDQGKDAHGCTKMHKIIIIVRKHTTSVNDKFHELPYYVARKQRRKRYVKLR